MAYLFNSALDDDAAETGKQNIFGGQETDQGTTTSGGSDAIEKTSNAGGSSGGGGGSAGTSPRPQQNAASSYNPKAASSAFGQAAARVQVPGKLQEAQGSLAQGSKELQEKANAYTQSAQEKSKTFDVDTETLGAAARGSKEAYQSVADRLRKSGPDSFDAFGGLGDKAPDVSNVADTRRLFQESAGPNYTSGQGRFDSALARRNSDFVQAQQQVLADQNRLRTDEQKMITDRTADANRLLGDAFRQSTDSIRTRLGDIGGDVVEGAQAREKAEDAKRAGLDPKAISQADTARLRDMIRDDFSKADPRSEQYRSLQFLQDDFDVTPYVNIDRDVDWQEMLTGDDVDQYNRIQGLLGGGDILQAGKGGGDAYAFDERAAYEGLMGQLQGRRQTKDAENQAAIARVQAEAEARAQEFTGRDHAQNARQKALQDLIGYARAKYAGQGDFAEGLARSMFEGGHAQDLSPYIRENTPLDWRSVLNSAEADQLNQLSADSGLLDRYGETAYRPEIDMRGLSDLFEKTYQPHLERKPNPTGGSSGQSNAQKARK